MKGRAFAYRIGVTASLVAAALMVGGSIYAQAKPEDRLIGTWVLDRAKSTYSGAAPERRTVKFEKTPMGIKHTTESMQGEVVYKVTYTFNADGKDYPADVAMAPTKISVTAADPNTLERTGKDNMGQVIETVKWTFADNGKRLIEDRDANNGAITSHQEFVKQ
jgi:hypothetical protein